MLTAHVIAVLLVASGAGPSTAASDAGVRLRGQIVCSVCWFEADRAKTPYGTPADMECAADCAAKGIPAALAVRTEEGFTLYLLEAGRHGWLDLISKQVEVVGEVGVSGDRKRIRVRSVRALEDEPVEAPDLELRDLAGVRQSLASLRGRVVVLNFWATWCAPCRKEMPALADIQSRFGAWGVQVVGASVDVLEARAQVEALARKLEVNFPVWRGASIEDMARFGLPSVLPGTAVLDREGRVAARFPSAVREKDLAAAIEPLLRETPEGAAGGPSAPASEKPAAKTKE